MAWQPLQAGERGGGGQVVPSLPVVCVFASVFAPVSVPVSSPTRITRCLPHSPHPCRPQARASRPWLSRMAGWHVALQCCLEVGPATLLLLPAAQGGLVAGACAYLAVGEG